MHSSYNIIKSNFAKDSDKKVISTEYVVKNFLPQIVENEEEIKNVQPEIDPEEILRQYEKIGKEIIKDAQNKKQAIEIQAQIDAENAEKEAYEKGYKQGVLNGQEDGYKKAYEETIEKAKLEAEEIVDKAETLLQTAKENYEEYLEYKKSEIINLALEIASNITKKKLSKEDSMNDLIEEAFRISKGEENLIIKINSLYYSEVRNKISNWKIQYSIKSDIFVLADDNIEQGNAIIEKPSGIVKVGIDIGMEQIKKALLG